MYKALAMAYRFFLFSLFVLRGRALVRIPPDQRQKESEFGDVL